MERMKAIKQNRKLHKKFCRAMGCFLITLVLLCAAGGNLIAKYYAGQKNKGVGVASSLYFASNVLKNVSSDSESEYPAIFNDKTWDGTGTCELDVDIRNFQSQLLYNDENLEITYQISFQLVGNNDGSTYTVTYGENTETIAKDSVVTFTGILPGGKQTYDRFQVKVQRPDGTASDANYKSVGIKVTAVPTAPSFIADTMKLGGILYASTLSASYSLTGAFENNVPTNYSGFPYKITYTPGEDQSAHRIKIIWDNTLEIDQFDSYYNELKDDNQKFGKDETNKKTWMIVSMQPYSTIQIVFYRAGFSDSSLAGYVVIEDLDKPTGTSEGSGN